tara:strand:+ start:3947 stop:4720 length:774 start_codon:yes stop_codon:yes gene_type:complete
VCAPDPNAGIRYQAKQEKKKKDQQYRSASLKYWNREVSAKQRSNTLTRGLTRARSDAYTRALWALGKGRQANEKLYRTRAKLSKYDQKTGTSRSSKYMTSKYQEILNQQSRIESTINNTFGRNMDIQQQGIIRQHQNYVAKNRQKLGVRPEYGAPVMMPPRDTQGQFFNSVSMGLQMASLAFAISDIRLKENIEEVGTSPKGHTIYEWNYKTNPHSRYRGAIAQEVAKKDPMAVDIAPNGMLGIYYDKIDVDMEKVS